jgi:4-hydroxy-tetrahydrodipicolinate synthase
VVRRAAKRIPVIAGTGANSTREAIELTQLAKEAGADACLMVTPYYNKPTQEGLFQHYKAVAAHVSIPIILYNVPSRTSCDMKPETVERLAAAVPSIVGIKEAASLERNREHFARVGGRLALLSGDDDLACECVLAGYQGVVSVSANVAPRQVRNCIQAALDGNRELARKLDAQLQRLHRAMFLETNPIPVKWAVARLGLIQDGIRLPLVPLSKQFHGQVMEAIQSAGIGFA